MKGLTNQKFRTYDDCLTSFYSRLLKVKVAHELTHLSIRYQVHSLTFINQWINESIIQWINEWINQSMNEWMNQSINETNKKIKQKSINQSTCYQPLYILGTYNLTLSPPFLIQWRKSSSLVWLVTWHDHFQGFYCLNSSKILPPNILCLLFLWACLLMAGSRCGRWA